MNFQTEGGKWASHCPLWAWSVLSRLILVRLTNMPRSQPRPLQMHDSVRRAHHVVLITYFTPLSLMFFAAAAPSSAERCCKTSRTCTAQSHRGNAEPRQAKFILHGYPTKPCIVTIPSRVASNYLKRLIPSRFQTQVHNGGPKCNLPNTNWARWDSMWESSVLDQQDAHAGDQTAWRSPR